MAVSHLPWDRSHWASIVQVLLMPEVNLTQKTKPCPALETSFNTAHP